jgi:hypothetical protein
MYFIHSVYCFKHNFQITLNVLGLSVLQFWCWKIKKLSIFEYVAIFTCSRHFLIWSEWKKWVFTSQLFTGKKSYKVFLFPFSLPTKIFQAAADRLEVSGSPQFYFRAHLFKKSCQNGTSNICRTLYFSVKGRPTQ